MNALFPRDLLNARPRRDPALGATGIKTLLLPLPSCVLCSEGERVFSVKDLCRYYCCCRHLASGGPRDTLTTQVGHTACTTMSTPSLPPPPSVRTPPLFTIHSCPPPPLSSPLAPSQSTNANANANANAKKPTVKTPTGKKTEHQITGEKPADFFFFFGRWVQINPPVHHETPACLYVSICRHGWGQLSYVRK